MRGRGRKRGACLVCFLGFGRDLAEGGGGGGGGVEWGGSRVGRASLGSDSGDGGGGGKTSVWVCSFLEFPSSDFFFFRTSC